MTQSKSLERITMDDPEMDPMKIIQQLITETESKDIQDNYETIGNLVQKSYAMRKEEKARSQKTEEYFKTLRKGIDESSSFLEKAKKDLENINFTFHKQKIQAYEDGDYEEYVNKTDEEIDEEIDDLKSQLAALDSKMKTLNHNTKGAEDNLLRSVKTLKNISQGNYEETK